MSVCQQTSITMLILLLSLHFAAISALFMAAGWYHNCVLERNVTKCFGRNNYGQLGQGDTNQRGDEPNEMGNHLPGIDLGSNFIPTQIQAGQYHTCAVSRANKVKCFGANHYGQLGYGDTMNRGNGANQMGDNLLEIDLGSNFKPTHVILGYWHTCVVGEGISATNTAKCFGRNNYGQLGYGDTMNRGNGANQMGDNLKEIDLGTSFIPMQIAVGQYHTCAVSTENKAKCFGRNYYGQLGQGDMNQMGDEPNEMGDNLPEIDFGSSFLPTQMIAGQYDTCA
eukprot:922043_1